jgi:hypothetical protein
MADLVQGFTADDWLHVAKWRTVSWNSEFKDTKMSIPAHTTIYK